MSPIYVVREGIVEDLPEIKQLLKLRHRKFMRRLTFSIFLSNWFCALKYLAIGTFASLNFASFWPLVPAIGVIPIIVLVEVIYATIVTRFSMQATLKSIEKRIREGIVPQHQIFVVRRIGALAGVLSLRDMIGNNLCMECEFFFCHEKSEMARTFVLHHTLKTTAKIAENQKFPMLLFRCCDIFPDLVASFDALGFELIMIHRVMVLFSSILMLTFARVISVPDERVSISLHIPGLVAPNPLTEDPGEPVRASASTVDRVSSRATLNSEPNTVG